ncbi:imidazole glycerol phosphate synthase subunit HisH [Vibrio genomosp. F10]|uniref:Imidazole glycerol phosphate synthase subunit HisH n=2 Tax=Vibrio genomosp. F10 TaxID=723171 RepID=A0A1B9R0L5_9VIBR|nr:imidazole glycerol phosphate synthase subunit HisH [Vibrio genomosp. F10]OCH77762.1 imidazole glycerol phosphate synthase, glutamine amidotransferase subunit [Vibrio genomosp. F10]OEE33898.1 imidazole glycerol phosphate synthase, glutamine amidotransferase subunit [Vibrio genomosp. F10 str. ZF-129]OEE85941.1 imidazole glycerol phosphate synthase, glutamine amidotransferase subunit [Vibrio genomosp. F10 str. 9ZD137]OEE92716.1 imidazole glycerol phosphate synthase, glutamine amidotransferase s
MSDQKVVIIDTGCANVSSVKFAIERLGYKVTISKQPEVVLAADKLFLPGVGTASEAMKNLQERDLIELVKKVDKPLLGICLGMQLLGRASQEKGQKADQIVECLGLCEGEVKRLQTGDLPLPHMGWNTVQATPDHPLFKGIETNEYFYFVHSFAMPVGEYTIGQCDYGTPFTAALQSGNYYGVQFHPERSSKAGSKLIQNFLEL